MDNEGSSGCGQISAGNELTTLSPRDATSTSWTALGVLKNAQSGDKEWSLES